MKIKYTKIRDSILAPVKNPDEKGLASLSHYMQANGTGSSRVYKSHANRYFDQITDVQFALDQEIIFDVPFPPVKDPKFTFIDLFAGIGGFRLAFQNQNCKCVFSSEWDKYAKRTYEANFGEYPFGDIRKIPSSMIPDHDILLGGFPCQPFSLAGVSKKNSLGRAHGFKDQQQGNLFDEIERILTEKRPKAFLLENVKNLASHDGGDTFREIERRLDKAEYWYKPFLIDAKFYVPQHRERIYIVGFDKKKFGEEIDFNLEVKNRGVKQIRSILEKNPDKKYTLTRNLWTYLKDYAAKHKAKGNGFGFGKIDDFSGVTRTLSARYYKDGSEILISQGRGRVPRRLTPNECKLLMGFPRKFRIQNIGISDTQLYKQFGNSVVVPVVNHIAAQMIEYMRFIDNSRDEFLIEKGLEFKRNIQDNRIASCEGMEEDMKFEVNSH